MKKFLIASGIASLAFAAVAMAQGYSFQTNLTVGSTGADVSSLQTYLIGAGFNIPSIASGAATKGYFGSQTKAAVQAFQAKNGVPATGFVGPLTRGVLNGGSSVAMSTGCPAGYTCTINAPVSTTCPAGMSCTPVGTGATVTGGAAGITTPGVAGTLAFSIWTTPSGVTAYKGQSYDVVGYKLQANASDMAVTNFSLDFNTRIWLYANSITIKDETGAVVGSLSNLSASNFSELTVGSDYRVTVPVNLVVKATQSKYLTVNLSFNAVSDRSSGPIVVTQAQIRAVDGTGITDTETAGVGAVAGEGSTYRTFSYQGSNVGQIVMTVDSSSPATGLIQVSTAAQTQNVVLGVYDIKVQNEPGTLQTLNLAINTLQGSDAQHALANVQLKINGQTYSASSIGTSTSFTNLNVPLQADTYVPMTILATVVQDTNGIVDNTTLQTVLTTLGTDSSDTTFNPSVIDATYNTVPNSSATDLTTNMQTFSANGVVATNLQTQLTAGSVTCSQTLTSCTQTFKFVYSLTAGNNPIYVSTNADLAINADHGTTPFTGGFSTTTRDFSDSDSNQDNVASGWFYVGPGATKTFTATYQANGATRNDGGTIEVAALKYGTSANAPAALSLISSQITSALKAVLFQ